MVEKIQAPDAGADDYVTKPSIWRTDLCKRIRAGLGEMVRPGKEIMTVAPLPVA